MISGGSSVFQPAASVLIIQEDFYDIFPEASLKSLASCVIIQ
jgi:hypothetical protein